MGIKNIGEPEAPKPVTSRLSSDNFDADFYEYQANDSGKPGTQKMDSVEKEYLAKMSRYVSIDDKAAPSAAAGAKDEPVKQSLAAKAAMFKAMAAKAERDEPV